MNLRELSRQPARRLNAPFTGAFANRLTLLGSLAGALLSVVFLAAVSVDGVLERFAWDYLVRRLEPKVSAMVGVVEQSAAAASREEVAAREILLSETRHYRSDPYGYLAQVLREGESSASVGRVRARFGNTPAWAKSIREHFDQVLRHLRLDLQLFLATNIVAFGLVVFLIRTGWNSARLHLQADILLLATFGALSVYVKQSWLFNLLLDHHMGLWYPALILGGCVELTIRWRRRQLREASLGYAKDALIG